MEVRRILSGEHHYNQRKRRPSVSSSETNVRRNNNRNQQGRSNENPDQIMSWEDLREGPLQDIFSRLNMVDYFIAGSVCKRWNLLSSEAKQSYFKSKPPLAIFASTYARKICSLFDISSGFKCATTLPYFARRRLIGMSCGYLIMEDMVNDVLLVNPLTKKEHHLTGIPHPKAHFPESRSIIFFSELHQDVFIVVLNPVNAMLRLSKLKGGNWRLYSYIHKPWMISDIVFFKDKLFILTHDSQIGTLNLEFRDDVIFLELKERPQFRFSGRFAISGEELFVIHFVPRQRLVVYIIDLEMNKWVKVNNLGDRVIFLCDLSCSILDDPKQWGGYQNCLYYLHFPAKCDVYSLNGQILNANTLVEAQCCRMRCWYSTHESLDIDEAIDN